MIARILASLHPAAREERRRERRGLPPSDPGPPDVSRSTIEWLGRAQDASATADGGIARHFDLRTKWGNSYPETTGYAIPTFLDAAIDDPTLTARVRIMVDWLISIQLENGAFQGGVVGVGRAEPVVFNTGQILLGLARGVDLSPAVRPALERAASWLVSVQAPDGSWPAHHGPHAPPGPRTYHTHVAWGLLEAARVARRSEWTDAAVANVRWALRHQAANGWFDLCSLGDANVPLTHTLGYALRGVIEAWRVTRAPDLLQAARRAADGLCAALGEDGHLPGRLRGDWGAAASWSCLTGTSQVAICWLLLARETGEETYREAAHRANRYVRRTIRLDGPPETRGAVKGSYPISGAYCRYQYPNWAAKFTADANRLELADREGGG